MQPMKASHEWEYGIYSHVIIGSIVKLSEGFPACKLRADECRKEKHVVAFSEIFLFSEIAFFLMYCS